MNLQSTVYSNGEGYKTDQTGAKSALTPEEMAESKAAANYQLELNYGAEGYKLQLKGTTKFEDKDAYEIIVTPPTGQAYTEYYDMKTHYKIGTVGSMDMGGVTVTQTVKYKDYKETGGGVVMPFSSTTVMSGGGQTQTIDSKVLDVQVNQGIDASVFQ